MPTAPIEVRDNDVTDSDGNPAPTPTPIARLIEDSAKTYTVLADRMTQHLASGMRVQRQTVAHYVQKPVIRMPPHEHMKALAHALGESPALVLHLFILSHEQYYRGLMGLATMAPADLESRAQSLADRVDALGADDRRRLLWALQAMVEAAEAEASAEPARAASGESAGAGLRRLGDRLLVDIGAAYTDETVRQDAEAVLALLAERRRKAGTESTDDSPLAS